MKILPLSDLHIKYVDQLFDVVNVDVIVLAGDIVEHTIIFPAVLEHFSKFCKHIMYVPGNHEYYHNNMFKVDETLTHIVREFNKFKGYDCVTFLGQKIIDNVNFVGSTLWTEARNENGSIPNLNLEISDNVFIRDYSNNPLKLLYTRTIHNIHRQYISDNLLDDKINIVVTHHSPSWKQQDPRYRDSDISHFFHSNLDEWIADKNIQLWIHGHVHNSSTTIIGDTKIISNPKGHTYRSGVPENPNFSTSLIIEV